MSSKPLEGRRIVPVIPRALTRRAKDKDSKSDQRGAQTNGKSATSPIIDGGVGVNQKEQETLAQKEAEKVVEVSEARKPVEESKKQMNGTLAQEVLARPFVPRQSLDNEGVVFGGVQDSSSASPAPTTTAFAPRPVQAMPPQYQHYDNGYYPAASQYPASSQYPAASQYLPASQYPPASSHPTASQYPPAAWMPPQMNGHMNGANSMSPSPSHSSVVLPGGSGVATPDTLAHKHHAPHPSFHVPPMDHNAKHLLDFLLGQFGKSEFSDYVLELSSSSKQVMLPVHSLLLARCPSLLSLVHTLPQRRNYTGTAFVQFPQSYYFCDPDAFAHALGFLYGAPLIDPARVLHSLPHASPGTDEYRQGLIARMRYVLSYIASGHCMNIADIAMHGANMASRLLTWDTLETLLCFTLDGQSSNDTSGSPVYGFYASQLLHQSVEFLVVNIFPEFVFDSSSPELPSLARLPPSSANSLDNPSRPDSREALFATPDQPPTQRLSGIRFGQAPPPDSDVSFPTKTLSSVLLSLPFHLLKVILEHYILVERLGYETVSLITRDVVRERERRRGNALSTVHDKSSAKDVLLWEESVWPEATFDDIGRPGVRLNRSRVG